MAISILHHHHSSHLLFESLLGKIAFVAEFCPQAHSKSHEISKPQLMAPRSLDSQWVEVTPHLLRALLPWSIPLFLLQPSLIGVPTPTMAVWSDTSKTGWGSYTSTDISFSVKWSPIQSLMHINILELLSVQLTLVGTPTKVSVCLSNVRQQDHSSCHKSAGIQESRHPKSCIVAVPQILERTPASVGVTHLGPNNVVADQLSRNSPIDSEWEPAPSCFRLLEDLCGLLEVDLFATPLGHKIETFVAPFAHPRALDTNTFTLDWNHFSSIYLFSPPKAIPRVLLKLIWYQDKGGLIFPKRPTAP